MRRLGSLRGHNVLVIVDGVAAVVGIAVLDAEVFEEVIVVGLPGANLKNGKGCQSTDSRNQIEYGLYLVDADLAVVDLKCYVAMLLLALDLVVDGFALGIKLDS